MKDRLLDIHVASPFLAPGRAVALERRALRARRGGGRDRRCGGVDRCHLSALLRVLTMPVEGTTGRLARKRGNYCTLAASPAALGLSSAAISRRVSSVRERTRSE